ncbi:MAG TPA: ABC transporter substrate-binding protein [Conexibacter sp.]
MNGAKGTITYCAGKDATGSGVAAVKKFNGMHTGVTVTLREFSPSTDEQRQQFVQRLEAKSGECDVIEADVIWTAEFASQGWIYDMTPYAEERRSEIIPATLETATFDGKMWAVPHTTDAAFLYYRDDQVRTPPTTWQQVYEVAKQNDGIVYQGAPYEGLTCVFLELAFAAGGKVLSADGKRSEIDSPQNVKALQLMVDGVKDGTAANGVTTYMEDEARRYFESGKATFMRNWPYAYALSERKGSQVAGKFKVMPLPQFEGGARSGILGGHNTVISVYSRNPGAALKWIEFYTGKEWQTKSFDRFSEPPTLAAVYGDPAIQKRYAFATELRDAVTTAKSRPVSPVYPQISQGIYTNVYAALSGKVSAAAAIHAADADIAKALATF